MAKGVHDSAKGVHDSGGLIYDRILTLPAAWLLASLML